MAEIAAPTWNGEYWTIGGGGTVWDSIVYDPELDLLYFGVGNGSPWSQGYRGKIGDNLFLVSIVAVKPDTGEYVWHYQEVPGDEWDFTSVQPMMLADLPINGETRKVTGSSSPPLPETIPRGRTRPPRRHSLRTHPPAYRPRPVHRSCAGSPATALRARWSGWHR